MMAHYDLHAMNVHRVEDPLVVGEGCQRPPLGKGWVESDPRESNPCMRAQSKFVPTPGSPPKGLIFMAVKRNASYPCFSSPHTPFCPKRTKFKQLGTMCSRIWLLELQTLTANFKPSQRGWWGKEDYIWRHTHALHKLSFCIMPRLMWSRERGCIAMCSGARQMRDRAARLGI